MILVAFGTRPEYLKIKPLLPVLPAYKLLFTGQHPDLLKDISVDYKIKIRDGANRLDQIISDCLLQFPLGDFDSVLVQGDTASAFACALAAFNRKKKIYYLEAGLRSYNLDHPYPEEGYRQLISRLADVNFCPTELSHRNLTGERVKGLCYTVGNTVLDNLLPYKKNTCYDPIVLVTLHRRENHPILKDWFRALNRVAELNPSLDFILPLHPNPVVQKHQNLLTSVSVAPPLAHPAFLNLLTRCRWVITDSGGIQEEASFFNKKVIVCRETTERPEGLKSGHLYLCSSPGRLQDLVDKIKIDYQIDSPCPYGDGQSSTRISELI